MKAGLLAAGLWLGLAPAAAWAQDCPGGAAGMVAALLVETIEQAEVVPGDQGLERHARATERGDLARGCGSLVAFHGRMTVHAESFVEIIDPNPTMPVLGKGPIAGSFHIFPEGGGAAIKGVLDGELDFAPTRQGAPVVLAQGTWWTNGRNATGGGFNGVALVPAPCMGGLEGLCYYDPTGTLGPINVIVSAEVQFAMVPLTAAEMIPAPSAKFIVTLFQ